MMDEEHTKEIMERAGVTRNGRPYQYKVSSKKRETSKREDLENDEEEVEDLRAMGEIEEILCTTYHRKTRGHVSSAE